MVRRFKLIDLSIQLGTAGTMIMISAILMFVSIISQTATIVCSIIYAVVMIFIFNRRRIPKQEFYEYFNIHEPAGFEKDAKYIHKRENP